MDEYEVSFEEVKDLLENGNYKEVVIGLTQNYKSSKLGSSLPKRRRSEAQQFKFGKRYRWISKYKSWALPPTIDQLHEIRDIIGGRKILEIGAGCGLWSALLRCVGCHVIVTDSKKEKTKEYIEVESLSSEEALRKYGSDVDGLFVSWGRGYPTKEEFTYFKGDLVLSVGESGGCTHNGYIDELYRKASWMLIKIIPIPQWNGIWDRLEIYQRINNDVNIGIE